MERAYRASTRLIGAITFLLGLGMLSLAIARGGGPLAVGVLAGLAFMVLGALRYGAAMRRDQ